MSRFAAGLRPVIYTVYVKEDAAAPAETAEFVREGFNFYAFIFGIFWAGYHRAWRLFALLLLVNLGISGLESQGVIGSHHATLLQIAVQIFLGLEANDYLGQLFKQRGYLLVDIVCGDTPLRAQLRFLERYFARTSVVSVVSAPAPTMRPPSPWSRLLPKRADR